MTIQTDLIREFNHFQLKILHFIVYTLFLEESFGYTLALFHEVVSFA